MMASFRRTARVYAAIAAMVPKEFLAYNVWVWMQFIAQLLSMTIFVFFWRAAYAGTSTLGGLDFGLAPGSEADALANSRAVAKIKPRTFFIACYSTACARFFLPFFLPPPAVPASG